MHAVALPEGHLDKLFAAIDAGDSVAFAGFLTDDAEFRFGSAPVVKGRDAIRQVVDEFFSSIDGCSHSVSKIWRDAASLACEGEVCYRRLDGTEIILPFVDTFEYSGELISSYRIYIDIGPLYAS